MTELRQEKIARVASDIGKTKIYGDSKGDLLILGWGGTYGACRSSAETLKRAKLQSVSCPFKMDKSFSIRSKKHIE